VDPDATAPIVAAAAAALRDHGPGFAITTSSEAMRLVDQRMYAQKTSSQRSVDRHCPPERVCHIIT
jgi:hypothetical protein